MYRLIPTDPFSPDWENSLTFFHKSMRLRDRGPDIWDVLRQKLPIGHIISVTNIYRTTCVSSTSYLLSIYDNNKHYTTKTKKTTGVMEEKFPTTHLVSVIIQGGLCLQSSRIVRECLAQPKWGNVGYLGLKMLVFDRMNSLFRWRGGVGFHTWSFCLLRWHKIRTKVVSSRFTGILSVV